MGTILSLWDAAALDAAGQDGEVAPTFINLADASIKMVKQRARLGTKQNDLQFADRNATDPKSRRTTTAKRSFYLDCRQEPLLVAL